MRKHISSLSLGLGEWNCDVVYFVGNGSVNRVKIGKSNGAVFTNRFAALKTGFPGILHVLGIMRGGLKEERELHKVFLRDRTCLEWFILSDEIKAFIKDNTYQVVIEKRPKKRIEKPVKQIIKNKGVSLRKFFDSAAGFGFEDLYNSSCDETRKAIRKIASTGRCNG